MVEMDVKSGIIRAHRVFCSKEKVVPRGLLITYSMMNKLTQETIVWGTSVTTGGLYFMGMRVVEIDNIDDNKHCFKLF